MKDSNRSAIGRTAHVLGRILITLGNLVRMDSVCSTVFLCRMPIGLACSRKTSSSILVMPTHYHGSHAMIARARQTASPAVCLRTRMNVWQELVQQARYTSSTTVQRLRLHFQRFPQRQERPPRPARPRLARHLRLPAVGQAHIRSTRDAVSQAVAV